MARYTAKRRLRWVGEAFARFARAVERRWARIRFWFKRHARDNVILAVLATIGDVISRPFRRFRKKTRDRVALGILGVAALVLFAVAFLSDRGGPGGQIVRAAEPPTTAAVDTGAADPSEDTTPLAPPDTIPPPLLLDASLTDGLTIGQDHIVVSGVTDPGATVVVAGIELEADDSGAFAADVPLALGPNRIDIVVTDQAGNARGAAITVVYKVDAPPPPPPKKPTPVVVTTTSTVPPTTTTRGPTTTGKKTTTTPPTTLATTSSSSTSTTSTTTYFGGLLWPVITKPTTTTQAPTTTAATTTAATTTAPTTTAAITTESTTPTSESTTTTTEETTTASTTTTSIDDTSTTTDDTTVPTDPPPTDLGT
ncbi:MAG TPA: hypothetical protein VMK16_18060 [Acidimicrobiales bacterium]|nr:hypothetical protein [Acidimicrobiales bacterium]